MFQHTSVLHLKLVFLLSLATKFIAAKKKKRKKILSMSRMFKETKSMIAQPQRWIPPKFSINNTPQINVYKFRGSRQMIVQNYLQDITSLLHSERYLVSIFENKWHSLVNLVSKQLAIALPFLKTKPDKKYKRGKGKGSISCDSTYITKKK